MSVNGSLLRTMDLIPTLARVVHALSSKYCAGCVFGEPFSHEGPHSCSVRAPFKVFYYLPEVCRSSGLAVNDYLNDVTNYILLHKDADQFLQVGAE